MVYFMLFHAQLESISSPTRVCFHNFTSIFESSQPHLYFFSLGKHFFQYPPLSYSFALLFFALLLYY